jgi:hypothetical protein
MTQPTETYSTELDWDWVGAIVDACGPPPDNWMANKFIAKLREHKRKHPAFKVERVAAMFIDAPPKVRAAYCYQDISKFTRSIHRAASFRSFVASQS